MIEQLQAQLDRLDEQLAWTHRLSTLGTLAAALAHEYNNLLTPIGSYAQLALNNPDNPDLARKALHAAVTGTERASRLADATLGFASPDAETHGKPTHPADCPLINTVEASLDCMAPIIRSEGITVSTELVDTRVAIDPLALQQVLVNLISNARHAMRETAGPKRITIRAKPKTQPDKQAELIELEVSDNGRGIPESVMGQLFEPFVTMRTDASGIGLGLSICKRLVESAGGTILACSTPGQGATFHLTLPVTASTAG